MLRKCGLFALSLAVLSTSLSVLFSDVSKAWSGDLPLCESVPNIISAIKADVRYSKEKTAYVIFKRDWSGPPLNGTVGLAIDWDNTNPYGDPKLFIGLTTSTNVLGLTLPAGGTDTELYSITNENLSSKVNNGSSNSNNIYYDLNCISIAENMSYKINNSLVSKQEFIDNGGQDFPTEKQAGNSLDPAVPCDWYDIACWMGDLASNVIDTMQDMWDGVIKIFERVIEFFTGLFVPSDQNIFKNAFDDLSDYMTNKLGFLTYPFIFISDQISALMTIVNSDDKSEWHCTGGSIQLGICSGICADNVLGTAPLCLRITSLEETFPLLWTTMIWFVRLALIVALIELMRNKYMSIVRA